MNSQQRRSRRRVASRIESQVRAELSQDMLALKMAAKKAEDESSALRAVRTEHAIGLCSVPHCFDILQPLGGAISPPLSASSASKTVYVEMVRYAVSIPYECLCGDNDPPISFYKEQAAHAIYKEFRKRAITEATEIKDERRKVYTLSLVLPIARNP